MSDITLLPAVTAFLAREHGVFIHGQHLASQSSSNIAVVNPANGQTIAHIADANQADVDHAVSSSRQGFTAWSHTSPAARAAVLFKLADLLEANREELAQLETLQSGKLIGISRAFEVEQAAHFLRYYAGWATKITGQTITPSLPSFAGERYSAFTLREPIGVVVGIVPWNFATMIAIWKLASALTTGCSIILKPSEFTPLTLLRIAELATEAGLPAGALNVLTGGGLVGKALIEHAGTDKVSFTGSVPTGIAVGQAAMGAKLTRATLELGGKNAVAFLPDVATDKAVDGIIEAGFLHSGQICAAGERFYVHRSRIDPLLDALSQRLGQLKIGSPLDETTQFGPVANKPHQQKLAELFAIARAEGSQIIHGGTLGDGPGCFVEPTVILARSACDTLLTQETFGPVATFLPYGDEDELLHLINASPYGLSASLWTNDLGKAMRMIPQIQAGTLWVNMHTLLDPAVPFGGIKASGIGREFGSAFIDDFTELKSVMIRY
ncbi:aldehyde dehydrogenase family protein [Pseudomonas putida]|uniref:aldehyde dehydrogenase family protein n=1 Tax=Pseudomonas putida TaxID=303 RepID=UPI0015774B06|nr:aldehyde dehydrogenase family protein [Pseudomonas putida]MCC9005184.1 aldehyde dehydrogenase family protein [Pseudomonas putida]NTY94982.1 aldehyde dehydrogenase family protein [Pseudomonas putida]NTZ03684.1 aldehyde dehydrogenase family protein [Pseudomonas putida]NTZ26154.1 aldehyde dehydrogenase family protein [Pseudomonas putida]NTZ58236.1 aldehyde dehydrogenase family protein [Pseudomonas putida]